MRLAFAALALFVSSCAPPPPPLFPSGDTYGDITVSAGEGETGPLQRLEIGRLGRDPILLIVQCGHPSGPQFVLFHSVGWSEDGEWQPGTMTVRVDREPQIGPVRTTIAPDGLLSRPLLGDTTAREDLAGAILGGRSRLAVTVENPAQGRRTDHVLRIRDMAEAREHVTCS